MAACFQRRNSILLLAAVLLLLCGTDRTAHAAACPPGIPCTIGYALNAGENDSKVEGSEACDADLMNQIYAKAYLEAEREVVVNQTVIRKPDSVMEYTCFDDFASMTAGSGGDIFSDSTEWRNRFVNIVTTLPLPPGTLMSTWMFNPTPQPCNNFSVGGDKLDSAIECMVLDGLEEYIDENFDHSFLGGTAAIDSNISDSIGPDSYNCNAMNEIWNIAKCDDFGSEIGFVSFEDLEADDPRDWPDECGGTSITLEMIEVARNDDWTYATGPDPLVTFSPLLLPPGGPIVCGDPIPTGVQIMRYEWDADLFGNVDRDDFIYDDKVCSNPSCYYDRENDICEE